MAVKKFGPLEPKIILGVGAHPDDLDVWAAGTVAHYIKQGARVYYLVLTDGGKGANQTSLDPTRLVATRHQEQEAAAKMLGVSQVFFTDYPDSSLQNNDKIKKDIVRIIRKIKPDVVITFDPSEIYSESTGIINHPDHRAAGQATLDAVYPLARNRLSFPELVQENLEPHKVKTVLLTNLDRQNFGVDISDTFDLKLKAVAAHTSQFSDINQLSTQLRQASAKLGGNYGAAYAEGFIRLDLPD